MRKHDRAEYICSVLVDHFAILELTPAASQAEIKSAYRRLARQHHPDLNPNDGQSADRFQAIQLAYETLTRPQLRQLYLEKRWYARAQNQPLQGTPLSLNSIVRQCVELERFVAGLDEYRMDRIGLQQHLIQCIEEWRSIRLDSRETEAVQFILQTVIRCASKLEANQAESVQTALKNWMQPNLLTHLLDDEWLTRKRRQERWRRLTPWLVLIATILLSMIIWRTAGSGA